MRWNCTNEQLNCLEGKQYDLKGNLKNDCWTFQFWVWRNWKLNSVIPIRCLDPNFGYFVPNGFVKHCKTLDTWLKKMQEPSSDKICSLGTPALIMRPLKMLTDRLFQFAFSRLSYHNLSQTTSLFKRLMSCYSASSGVLPVGLDRVALRRWRPEARAIDRKLALTSSVPGAGISYCTYHCQVEFLAPAISRWHHRVHVILPDITHALCRLGRQ